MFSFIKEYRRFFYIFFAVFGIISLFSSYSVIEPGNTGIVFNTFTGNLYSAQQGLVWKLPFVTTVQSYPTSLRTYTMVKKSTEGNDDSIDLPTKEGQHIRQDISITYNTADSKAADVYKSFRGADIEAIEASFIRRTAITVAQNISGQMNLTEVISSSRDSFQQSIQKNLSVEFAKMGFILDKVNLGASHLPETIERQMQEKMAAQQDAQKADYEFTKRQSLAKAAVAEAHGQADAMMITAKAQADANKLLQNTLTPTLIQAKAIEKWNGQLPQITSGVTPFINVKKTLE